MSRIKTIAPYLLLLGWPALTIVYGQSLQGQYRFLRQWSWENLAWIALAIPFLLAQERLRLPQGFGRGISAARKWLIPAAWGLGFGLLDIVIVRGLLHPEPYDTLPPYLQPFPYSILLFPSGALDVEIFYRLIPISVMAWILLRWGPPTASLPVPEQGGSLTTIQWLVIGLTSLREPLEQWPAGPAWFIAYSVGSGLAMNALQGYCFLRYGFSSALAVRLGHYLVWHILLGAWVQYVEKAAL